jgi:hypothetical protein
MPADHSPTALAEPELTVDPEELPADLLAAADQLLAKSYPLLARQVEHLVKTFVRRESALARRRDQAVIDGLRAELHEARNRAFVCPHCGEGFSIHSGTVVPPKHEVLLKLAAPSFKTA